MLIRPTLTRLLKHPEVRRFARFAVVGFSGTLVDFFVLTGLKSLLGFPTISANTLSYLAGVANNYTLNRLWTYRDSRRKGIWLQLLQFLVVSTIGVILSNTIILLLEAPFGTLIARADLGYLPAKVIATGIVAFWNFLANRFWTFNDLSSSNPTDPLVTDPLVKG